jgi:hypothetical protein
VFHEHHWLPRPEHRAGTARVVSRDYERHPLFYEARDALDRVKRAPVRSQGDFV